MFSPPAQPPAAAAPHTSQSIGTRLNPTNGPNDPAVNCTPIVGEDLQGEYKEEHPEYKEDGNMEEKEIQQLVGLPGYKGEVATPVPSAEDNGNPKTRKNQKEKRRKERKRQRMLAEEWTKGQAESEMKGETSGGTNNTISQPPVAEPTVRRPNDLVEHFNHTLNGVFNNGEPTPSELGSATSVSFAQIGSKRSYPASNKPRASRVIRPRYIGPVDTPHDTPRTSGYADNAMGVQDVQME
ncbi:hypothetical protein IAT38_005713 [Cryptococcus sp. DSM 104549]